MSTSYNHGYGPGQLLSKVLKRVSRSFYLSLRVLPSPIREPVGLAYLLARTADTIADTTALPSADRLERLIDFRGQVRGEKAPKPITNLTKANGDEHLLLWAVPETLALLEASAWEDQERIRSVVTTLTEGIRTAGNHTIEWNAEGYPSGVYFVKLDAGEFTQTQKLMLVK